MQAPRLALGLALLTGITEIAVPTVAHARRNYPGWVCRRADIPGNNFSTQPQYLVDGSYSDPGQGFQFPTSICAITNDTDEAVTHLVVYYEKLSGSMSGVSCRVEARSVDGLVLYTSPYQTAPATGSGSFTFNLSPNITGFAQTLLLVQCPMLGGRIKSLSTY